MGLLAALPSLAGARPVEPSAVAADELLERVRTSDTVGWSGYGESRGTLELPDVSKLADLPSLVGGTTRARLVARYAGLAGRRCRWSARPTRRGTPAGA